MEIQTKTLSFSSTENLFLPSFYHCTRETNESKTYPSSSPWFPVYRRFFTQSTKQEEIQFYAQLSFHPLLIDRPILPLLVAPFSGPFLLLGGDLDLENCVRLRRHEENHVAFSVARLDSRSPLGGAANERTIET